jgi:hypothetical protein
MNEKNKNMILKAVQKLKNNIMNVDISQDFGKSETKFIVETPTSTKENDSNISLQVKRINKDKEQDKEQEQEKDNLNYNNHSKKQLSVLEIYDVENKSSKKGNKNFINDKDNKIAGSNNNEKKSLGYFKSMTINSKIKKIKSPFFQYNYINCENSTSNDNINNANNLTNSEIEKPKRTYHKFNSNDNMNANTNKTKSINKMNSEQNKKISNNINNNLNSIINYNNRKLNKIIKNQNIKINTGTSDKKIKESDICFDENELDENTLSVTTGKYIENKKTQTMINKVLHFETGSSEIFNNFRTQTNNSLSNMSFLNKNQSTKSMKDKKKVVIIL